MAAGIMGMVSEKVSFAKKLPMLMKATADNENPTTGYLYQEVNKMTYESLANCQSLVDYLNAQVKKSSPHVKHKALKIMTYLSANGHSEFRSALRHQDQQIREAASFRGSMNSLHGDALNQKVRKAATELIELLFNIENPESTRQSFIMAGPTGQKMEGFGNTPVDTPQRNTLLDTVKGLGNKITKLSGQWKEGNKEELSASGGVYSEQFVSFGDTPPTSDLPSSVKFVNYHEDNSWTPKRSVSDEELAPSGNPGYLKSLDHYEDIDDEYETHDDEYDLRIESWLVKKVTEEGGVRAVPTKESLDQFTNRCSTLNMNNILCLLNKRMEEPNIDVQMKCLYVVEHLLKSSIPNVAPEILKHCTNLQHLVDTENGKLKAKASKVLCTAKSHSRTAEKQQNEQKSLSTNSSSNNVQKRDLVGDLLGPEPRYSENDVQRQCPTDPSAVDIFDGLQVHERHQDVTSCAQSSQSPVSDDFKELVDICAKSDSDQAGDTHKTRDIFDPLEGGVGREGITTQSNMADILGLNQDIVSAQNPTLPGEFDLGLTPSTSQTGNPLVAESSSFQNVQSCHQTPSNFDVKANKSSLMDLLNPIPEHTAPSNTPSPGYHGNPVSSTNWGIMSRPLHTFSSHSNSTIPLKLSKPPTQTTEFDFLSKNKRESAFSFVQDEMKASKK